MASEGSPHRSFLFSEFAGVKRSLNLMAWFCLLFAIVSGIGACNAVSSMKQDSQGISLFGAAVQGGAFNAGILFAVSFGLMLLHRWLEPRSQTTRPPELP